MQQIEILYPDDWHCHLRDDPFLATTVPASAKQFKRAIVMPNLVPPITDVAMAKAYRDRILSHRPASTPDFTPLMVLYLTQQTTPAMVQTAKESKLIFGYKLYPSGVTTNSEAGVKDLTQLYPIFEALSDCQLPLLIHGEVTTAEVDIFDREAKFIEQHLISITREFPALKIVFEHITTAEAVDFVLASSANIAATITPHHLLLDRNAMLVGCIKPDYYCLPVLKRKSHQQALLNAATSGNPKFFIGTDSAPHGKSHKECAAGCAGIFNALTAMEIYTHIFEQANALDKLEGFCSRFGADFYGLPYNKAKLRLIKSPWQVPQWLDFDSEQLKPFLAGETLAWQFE